jgi:dienelactone hydrolase
MRSDGNTHYYWLDAEALREKNKQLLTPEKMASLVQDVEGDAWELKVIKDFFEGTRLKEIPASRKKRSVILKWFADKFAYGTLYKEAQVNEVIQRHHEDSAFIRREMIGGKEGLMQREGGFYWRIPSGDNWRSVMLRSADRQPLQAWIGTPAGPGPFPTVIELHEGPGFVHVDWLSPLAQKWVEAGFAYMVVNYPAPASGSYALSFLERIAGDPGHWELEDLLTARAWLLEQHIADPKRILLMGWSYSASMVLLALGKQPPDTWAGAIAGSPVTDWVLEYEAVEDRAPLELLFSGRLEEKREVYRESSPSTHIEKIHSPILLLKNEDVPGSQQIDLYGQRLQELRKSVIVKSYHSQPETLDIEQMIGQQEVIVGFAKTTDLFL